MSYVEVTRETFGEVLPQVKKSIDRAAFIALDTEFSGLVVSSASKPSLFDSPEERYSKARSNVKSLTLFQVGISAYISVGQSRYEVESYNFYLNPQSVGYYDPRYMIQSQAVKFLTENKLDFNKVFYHGIPFLNDEQSQLVEQYWRTNTETSDSVRYSDTLRKYCSRIARWLVQARDGDVFTMGKHADDLDIPNHILHEKIVHRLDKVWPVKSSEEAIAVRKITVEEHTKLMASDAEFISKDTERLMDTYLGFTHVVRYLAQGQKIIVGHNMYLDLMFLYDKFINHLPSSYESYKKQINETFPHVYDTKHIVNNIRSSSRDDAMFDSTGLSDLYCQLRTSPSQTLYPPTVTGLDHHSKPSGETTSDGANSGDCLSGQVHEAGYDSLMCGYVFLRLIHDFTVMRANEALLQSPLSFYDYGPYISQYKNKVNTIRALSYYICLDGTDPVSRRPSQLYVATRSYTQQLSLDELALMMSAYGTVDITPMDHKRALVAVGNFSSARRILQAFQSHDKYKVVKYNYWRHSLLSGKLVWGGLFLSAGICSSLIIMRSLRRRAVC